MAEPNVNLEDLYNENIMSAVGLLFLVSAATESSLGLELTLLSTAPNPSNAKLGLSFSGMALRTKLSKLYEMARFHDDIDLKSVETLCDKIDKIYDDRNRIAHNLSQITAHGIKVTSIKLTRKSMSFPEKEYTPQEIRNLAKTLRETTFKLSGLLKVAQPHRELG